MTDPRRSPRLEQQVPTASARYATGLDVYYERFKRSLANFRNNPPEAEVRTFWHHVAQKYFPESQFMVEFEFKTDDNSQRKADVVVLKVGLRVPNPNPGQMPPGIPLQWLPALVLECKGSTPRIDNTIWNGHGQVLEYAKDLCKSQGLPAIWYGVAQGRLVKFFKFTKNRSPESEPLRTAKPAGGLDALDVETDHPYIHEALQSILNGLFVQLHPL